jgi:hypothetical protein
MMHARWLHDQLADVMAHRPTILERWDLSRPDSADTESVGRALHKLRREPPAERCAGEPSSNSAANQISIVDLGGAYAARRLRSLSAGGRRDQRLSDRASNQCAGYRSGEHDSHPLQYHGLGWSRVSIQ